MFFFEKFFCRPDLKGCEYIFFGLGNPGKKYRSTRHNAGFAVVDCLTEKRGGSCRMRLGRAAVGVVTIGQKKIALVKPITFVNSSGEAVRAVRDACGLPAEKIVVIVDDFNINLGTVRLRTSGSHGGHNGLKSCISVLGENFPRLRVGIGPLPGGISVIDFVLGDFKDHEKAALKTGVARATEALIYLCDNGLDAAMNIFNTSKEPAGGG